MRRKSDAHKFLERVEMIDCIVRNKLIEQKQWRDIAMGITSNMDGERVSSSGSRSKMEDALNKCIDMESEINDTIDRLIDTKRDVISILEQLESPMEYRILHMRYIQFMDLKKIAEKLGLEYTNVTTINGRGITNVQRILDERA